MVHRTMGPVSLNGVSIEVDLLNLLEGVGSGADSRRQGSEQPGCLIVLQSSGRRGKLLRVMQAPSQKVFNPFSEAEVNRS